jgi:hypothetical protein
VATIQWLPPKGRAADLDEVVQDLLHLYRVEDTGMNSHF